MNLIRLSITRPVSVLSAVLIILLFGIIEVLRIPIQVIPDIREPVVTISTQWSGASPLEVEKEILNRQEEVLKGLEGVRSISSSAQYGWANIEVEFFSKTDIDESMLLISNRLSQVSGYPTQAGRPRIWTASTDDEPMAMLVLSLLPGNEHFIESYGDLISNTVSDRLERVHGVESVSVYGGQSRELRVVMDPMTLSHYNLTIPQVAEALKQANISTTMGVINEGKRRYIVRMSNDLTAPERVKTVLLHPVEDKLQEERVSRVMVGDLAKEISFAYKERNMNVHYMGHQAVALYVTRKDNANILETMHNIKSTVSELNEVILKKEGVILTLSYDETSFLKNAISLVIDNIYIGGSFAFLVLLLFLRSVPATLIIVSSIPISVIGAFIGMAVLGRTLNIISLTGIAFAVGMVVDASIVVLENIFRLRQNGYSPSEAAYTGAVQVWWAILASTLTTVMVFIPVFTLELEIGQLFRDIAVALSVSVMVSLVIAVTVVPALGCRFLGKEINRKRKKCRVLAMIALLLDTVAKSLTSFIINLISYMSASRLRASFIIGITTVGLALTSWILLPPLEYLPQSTHDLLSAVVRLPSGYNLESAIAIADNIERATCPLWTSETSQKPEHLRNLPEFNSFFLRTSRNSVYIEGTISEPKRIGELRPVIQEIIDHEPGVNGVVFQPTLFSGLGGKGRTIDLNITGSNLDQVIGTAQRVSILCTEWLSSMQKGYYSLISNASLKMAAPEVHIQPDHALLTDIGITAHALSQTISAFNDGLQVDEILVDGQLMSLVLYGSRDYLNKTQDIDSIPVVTHDGHVLPLSALADVTVSYGPGDIRHLEYRRNIALKIQPKFDIPLETAVEQVKTQVVDKITTDGLPPGVTVSLSGAAGMLTESWNTMKWQLLLALTICYLLMALLYESFIYPLLVLTMLPQATAGAIFGLFLLNLWVYQPLDMLTMLGFVILTGTVVNNAILIIYQTLHYVRVERLTVDSAIISAVQNRLRPIFMTTLTTLFGMLPLVVLPGTASELYRGLGTVMLGGLVLSTILTLLILPPLLSLTISTVEIQRVRTFTQYNISI